MSEIDDLRRQLEEARADVEMLKATSARNAAAHMKAEAALAEARGWLATVLDCVDQGRPIPADQISDWLEGKARTGAGVEEKK